MARVEPFRMRQPHVLAFSQLNNRQGFINAAESDDGFRD